MAERLGDMLVRRKVLDSAKLQSALEEQSRTNRFLGEILVERGYVSEEQLLEILAEQFETKFISLADLKINPIAIKMVPSDMAWEHKIMPVEFRVGVLLIAVSNPLDVWPMSVLQSKLNLDEVRFLLATKSEIRKALEKHYGPEVV